MDAAALNDLAEDGKITSLDEYVDSAPLAAVLGSLGDVSGIQRRFHRPTT
jgi:hypothetical protein